MKSRIVQILVLPVLCGFFVSVSAQNYSNKGTDFWVAWMNHVRGVSGAGPSQMSLYLTSDVATSGSVSIADGSFNMPFTIVPNQITTVSVPGSAFLGYQGRFLKGIHITSAKPIVAYAHIYAQAVSGATLVLPVTVLAKEYVSINYTQQSNEPGVSYSAFTVIATEDDTRIEITPTANLTDGKVAGQPFTVDLRKGEVYQALSYSDLTGSRIRSVSVNGVACKKVAVFSGSGKVFIGCYMPQAISSDNLFQQVYPQRAWGKNYVTVPLRNRPYDIYRIVLSDAATNVVLNGQNIPASSFRNGLFYEFESTTPNVIAADKPVQVVQYSVSERQGLNCTLVNRDQGDPEMIILSPIEQSVNQVTLYSSGYHAIQDHYINIIIKKGIETSFKIDGRTPVGNFAAVPGNTEYVYSQFQVSVGTHILSADDGFNAVAYGFGSAESYGYAAGTNVKDLKQNIQVQSAASNQMVTSGCVNQDLSMLVTLGFPTSKLTWNINNGTAPVTDASPTAVNTFVKDGQTFYQYKLPGQGLNARAGNYTIQVEAFNPVADECGSTETISLDFSIYNPPTAKFTAPEKACISNSVLFSDQSVAGDNSITAWQWDFGDGGTSALKSPKHLYMQAGTYTARLIVKGETGCMSSVFEKLITVNPVPVADFTMQNSGCKGEPFSILNKTPAAAGTIKWFIWDYGDGKKDTITSATEPVLHTFSATGIFAVTLTVVSDETCRAVSLTKSVTIYNKPVADFSVPKVCVNDAYVVFTNQTEVATGGVLRYHWEFGDGFSTAQNNLSTDRTPQHRYTQAGTYTVKLIVTNADGCSSTQTKQLTVNSATIAGAFEALNDQVCSSVALQVRDVSTIDIGNIIRVEWDWGDGSAIEADENPARQKRYTHQYAAFSSPFTKTFTVRLRAYSGASCSIEAVKIITLKAVPVPVFTNLHAVCVDGNGYQLTADVGRFTGTGTGTFSGPGVTGTGFFDPAKAGVGAHLITYSFLPDNGCSVTKTATVTVDPLPGIKLASDTAMLEGGKLILQPKISGNNLSYKWSPAVGLSRDDVANPTASPATDITYTLTVSSLAGCTMQAPVRVRVLKKPLVPNTFTPNGDGINDLWAIQYLNSYSSCSVEIFNRYGQKVFNSVGYPTPWNGRVNGADVPAGVYFYTIDPKNGGKLFSGYVTIIR